MSDDSNPAPNTVCVWSVEFSSQAESRYRYNGHVTVISTSAQAALYQVMVRHPDAVIHALHKRSRGELIVDPNVGVLESPVEVAL